MKQIIVIISLLVSLISASNAQESQLAPYFYLLGAYDIKVYSLTEDDRWIASGTGYSVYQPLFDSTYIDETFQLKMSTGTLTMRSTLGVDGRTKQLRLVALDREYSTMDVYAGESNGQSLILSNLKTDVAVDSDNGEKMSFRLTISPGTTCHHEMLVEYTHDNGASWKKFSRQEYFLKKS